VDTKASAPSFSGASECRSNDAKGTTAKSESAWSIGGRSKRQTAAESGGPVPTLDDAIAMRDAVNRRCVWRQARERSRNHISLASNPLSRAASLSF
jgi:hypothetical protein